MRTRSLLLASVLAFSFAQSAARAAPVAAKKLPVKDTYHATEVVDPYRWLEKQDSPETKAVVTAQNAHARAWLDKVPGRKALRARLAEILGASTVLYNDPDEVAGVLYVLKTQPPKQHPFLVAMKGPNDVANERVVVDPDVVDKSGKTAIDWFRVSPDGKLVAVSLSSGGSETGDVHVYDTATGKEVERPIPGVNAGTAGGDLAWLPDSKGFYYTRYPRGEERPKEDRLFYVQLYRHELGTPTEKDTYELGKDFPRIAEIFLDVASNGDVLVSTQNGDGREFMFHIKTKGGAWRQLAKFEDRVVQMFFGERKDLYLISLKDAPRGKLLRAPIEGFSLDKAKVVVPEGRDTLVADIWTDHAMTIHCGRIYTRWQTGGPSEIRVFDLDGKPLPAPEQLPVSAVGDPVPLHDCEILFPNTSFVEPTRWMLYSPKKGTTVKTAISARLPVDLSGVTVLREKAKSKDGTEVPVNILLPKGVAPKSEIPFVVTGYGGYGYTIDPSFQALRSALLDRGVGVAIANLRGGSEYGEEWHKQGALTKKQNVFDDFIGVIEHLSKAKHAKRDKIAITGGSNGGLLMGAVITQRPELVAAVASMVGIYDMLRVETEPNGVFNTTEFGSVKDKAQFDALYAYSPYHRVKDGVAYPPVIFLLGANDVRVAPWHSWKMIARLQEASSSKAPLLTFTSFETGHGIGSGLDQIIDQNTDAYAFMLVHLGVPLERVPRP